MALTTQQLQSLKSAIAADGTMSAAPSNSTGNYAILAALNAIAAGPFIVWRTDIKSSEVVAAIVGTEFAALTAVKQTLLMMLISPGVVDASSANVQADFSAIFSAGTTLTALAALAKRSANVAEKTLATGTGTTGSPATLGFVGPVTYSDVEAARAS
jgi:hypothetical protein